MTNAIMQSPFFDVGFRVLAAYLCFDSGRKLRNGLIERRITFYSRDVVVWVLEWLGGPPSSQVFHRDTAPIRYWSSIVGTAFAMVLCFVAVFVGYWQPNP